MKYKKVVRQLKKMKEVLLNKPNNDQAYVNALVLEITDKLQEIEDLRAIEREMYEEALDYKEMIDYSSN